jgi:hypothetical protein
MTKSSHLLMIRTIVLAAVAVSAGSCGRSLVRAGDNDTQGLSAQASADAVTAFLHKYCLDCHSDERPSGSLRLDDLLSADDSQRRISGNIARWILVGRKLWLGEMPPPESRQPSQPEIDAVLEFISRHTSNDESEPARSAFTTVRHAGNRLKHSDLFSGEISGPAFTPARIWRINPQAYSQLVAGLQVPSGTVPLPFQGAGADGFRDFASIVSIDETATAQLIDNAQAAVMSQIGLTTAEQPGLHGHPSALPEFSRLLNATGELDRQLLADAVTRQFERVLHRRPTTDELKRHVELLERCIADAGLPSGVVVGLSSVLLLPEAVFRFEIGSGESDEFGRRFLAPRELAIAVALPLTDDRTDGVLLQAAAEGRLTSRSDVEREVRRMLGRGPANNPRLLRFFREYFEYGNALSVFKDASLNVHHNAEALVSDTDQLIEWVLKRDRDVLSELLTTRKSFVNSLVESDGRINKATQQFVHTSYGLRHDWEWVANQPVELPAAQRSGILTQPSWLVAHSSNFENQPIQRGRWIRERLLGGLVPDVPITVDARLPNDPHRTLRQRLRVTREEACWRCHQRMNSLGLPFEQFDHFGRFRTDELVSVAVTTATELSRDGSSAVRSLPVNTTGEITDAIDAALNRQFDGPLEMLAALAESKLVRQVFVRHAFRYFLGRNEMLSDSPTLIAADDAYVRSGGSFQALVTSLLTSDSFLYRRPEVEPSAAATSTRATKTEPGADAASRKGRP